MSGQGDPLSQKCVRRNAWGAKSRFGQQQKSNHEVFVYYIKDELRAAKWRDWKMHIVWEPEPNTGPKHLETPWIFNLTQDPKEETDVGTQASWVRRPLRVLIHEFQQSLKVHPPILPGAPDDYVPARVKRT